MIQFFAETAPDTTNDAAPYWREKLAAACRQLQVEAASLGIIGQDELVAVSYGLSASFEDCTAIKHPAFCVVKLLTSTLVARLASLGKLRFNDEIRTLLPLRSDTDRRRDDVLKGITVSHLLSHTHGFGCINLDATPVAANGLIDYERVLGLLQRSGKIFAPGKFFSYGVEGYMLLGIVIEHLMQNTYSHVLHKDILAELAKDDRFWPEPFTDSARPLPICPSSGKGLDLPMHLLLAFVNCFVKPQRNALNLSGPLGAEIFTTRIQMPGWSPTISGCCYGWKNFTNNWYGQNGMDNRNLMYVRVNPVEKTAICVVAHAQKRNPAALPALLFEGTCPALGFNITKQPRILSDAITDSNAAIIGVYGNDYVNFTIRLDNARLAVEITSMDGSANNSPHRCYLYPAEGNIFFLSKPWQYITFLQLVTDECAAKYLWDHTQMWPVVPCLKL